MELLAPAGSFEALRAAVQSGADAVYIGGSEFSARRSAVNFTDDEIKAAADYCHVRGVSLHVAANILIKDGERDAFVRYMTRLSEYGVDAVIIQDIGMAAVCRKILPDLPLHASTQMTVSSVAAARKMKEIGFSRIVLARELSKEAIQRICSEVDIEVEIFAHGAICMGYSGQCLMSSIIGGRSGNRGMCAQPCRLPYELDGKKGYLLSPKDLCMIDRLGELEKIGVTSLKIEGRLKRKEYVAAVCGVYRRCMDGKKPDGSDIDELKNAFNRSGFTSGYYDGALGKNMMSYENPSNIAENTFSADVKNRCREDADMRKTAIDISAELVLGKPLTVEISDKSGHCISVSGTVRAETAIKRPLDAARLEQQLAKLGNTPFYVKNISTKTDGGVTIPISEINDARRRATELLEKEICKMPERRSFEYIPSAVPDYYEKPILTAQVADYEQAKACIENGITEIYVDTPLANRLCKEFKNVHIIARLAPVPRDDRVYEPPLTDSVLISNIGQFDADKKCFGDFRLNITNRESTAFYSELERITLSPELNMRELQPISAGCEIIGYGRLPLMITENCPLRALGKCRRAGGDGYLTDRKNEKFPLKCNEGCALEILNSKPIYLADKPEIFKKLKISSIRLLFTVENFAECGKIISEYKKAVNGEAAKPMRENSFTRGHFYRGVD